MPRAILPNERLTPRKHARQERSRATVATILEAAAQVLESSGYDAASTDAIAVRAGVSVGSIYQYFPNKDALIAALGYCHLVESAGRVGPVLARLASPDPPPVAVAIRELVRASVACHEGRDRLHRLLFERMPMNDELAAVVGAHSGFLPGVLALYLERVLGVAAPTAAVAAGLAHQTLVHATHELLTAPPPGASAADCERELVRLLTAYVTALGQGAWGANPITARELGDGGGPA